MSLLLLDSTAAAVVPQSPFVSAFALLVAQTDRQVLSRLGGSPVNYQPLVGDAVDVSGVFDEQYLLVKGDPLAGVEALGPAVFLRLEDLPIDPEDDEPTITIDALAYRVTERRPDGMGGIVLALRQVQ
jgi:hypothetical protein